MSGVDPIQPVSLQHAAGAAPGSGGATHIISADNRHSRIALKFQDLTPEAWCELSFHIGWHPKEEARIVHDFASIGVSFLTQDGSSIDFAHVPGLTRAQIDPYNAYIAGPSYHDRNADPSGMSAIRVCFRLPSPAAQILVTIRSWHNSHPFQVSTPVLRQFGANQRHQVEDEVHSQRRALQATPRWFQFGLVPGRPLYVRGQILTANAPNDGAVVRVVYRDSSGEAVEPPYPDMLSTPELGSFINLPANLQARRFTVELTPPENASSAHLGFCIWHEDASTDLGLPLEASLEDELRLESLSDDDDLSAAGFLRRLGERLSSGPAARVPHEIFAAQFLRGSQTPLRLHHRLSSLKSDRTSQGSIEHVHAGAFSPWPVPDAPLWNEDPYRSPAWRMEYQSLSWLLPGSGGLQADRLERAIDLALSWSQTNPWGQPQDALSLHPLPLSVRTEVLLDLLLAAAASQHDNATERRTALLGEVIRHGMALSEIVSQNVFSYSVYQIHASGALLSLAKALPKGPLSGFWTSVALLHLQQGFDDLIDPAGTPHLTSMHYRMEALSLGFILCHVLQDTPDFIEIRSTLLPRLQEALIATIAMIDPKGMLPAFGEHPQQHDHAPWVKRLITEYAQHSLLDERLRAELSYPRGHQQLSSATNDLFGARYVGHKGNWGYFCANLSGSLAPHGHLDCTSFVFASDGAQWICDSGGSSQSESGPVHRYLLSSQAHNVAVPAGREQCSGEAWLQGTADLDEALLFEVASNVYGPGYDHRRFFLCLKSLNGMAVLDSFTADEGQLQFEGFLHFSPEVVAALASSRLVLGYHGQKKLRIVPHIARGRLGGLDIIHGRSDQPSSVQGYVFSGPGSVRSASVLRYSVAGETGACGGVILASDDAGLAGLTRLLGTPALKDRLSRDEKR
jgi:hypothetical protein